MPELYRRRDGATFTSNAKGPPPTTHLRCHRSTAVRLIVSCPHARVADVGRTQPRQCNAKASGCGRHAVLRRDWNRYSTAAISPTNTATSAATASIDGIVRGARRVHNPHRRTPHRIYPGRDAPQGVRIEQGNQTGCLPSSPTQERTGADICLVRFASCSTQTYDREARCPVGVLELNADLGAGVGGGDSNHSAAQGGGRRWGHPCDLDLDARAMRESFLGDK